MLMLLVWVTLFLPMHAWGDDQPPSSNAPSQGSHPQLEAPNPPVTPSPRDPGIVKRPDIDPVPGAVVQPPVVDPKMAVNPDEPPVQESAPPPDTMPPQPPRGR